MIYKCKCFLFRFKYLIFLLALLIAGYFSYSYVANYNYKKGAFHGCLSGVVGTVPLVMPWLYDKAPKCSPNGAIILNGEQYNIKDIGAKVESQLSK